MVPVCTICLMGEVSLFIGGGQRFECKQIEGPEGGGDKISEHRHSLILEFLLEQFLLTNLASIWNRDDDQN